MPVIAKRSQPAQKFKSWSASRFNDYSACPKRAFYKHIAKLPEPESPQMARGTEIHKKAEDYVKGVIARIPAELKTMTDTLKMLRALRKKEPGKVIVEDNWAFTPTWDITHWQDWNGCAVRIKLDFAYAEDATLHIGDWKTGKFNGFKLPEYMLQQELYALAGLLKYPAAERVAPKLYFTDADVIYPREGTDDPEFVFTRKDEPRLIKLWDKRVKPMLNDTTFKEKPGDACRFCHYKKANGGPCKY